MESRWTETTLRSIHTLEICVSETEGPENHQLQPRRILWKADILCTKHHHPQIKPNISQKGSLPDLRERELYTHLKGKLVRRIPAPQQPRPPRVDNSRGTQIIPINRQFVLSVDGVSGRSRPGSFSPLQRVSVWTRG